MTERHVFGRFALGTVKIVKVREFVPLTDAHAREVGRLVIPEGAHVVGDTLVLPDGTRLTADDALAAARDRPENPFGLRFVPAEAPADAR